MTLHAVVLLVVFAFVVLRESRLAQARGAGEDLAKVSREYVKFLSLRVMAGRPQGDWLADHALRTKRTEFIASMCRVYEVAGIKISEKELGEFIPALNDAQQWSEVASLDAGFRRSAERLNSLDA